MDLWNHILVYRSTRKSKEKIDLVMAHKILNGICRLKREALFKTRTLVTRVCARKLLIRKARKNVKRYFFVNKTVPDLERLTKKQAAPVT